MRVQRLSKALFTSFSCPNFRYKTGLFEIRDIQKPRHSESESRSSSSKKVLGLRTEYFEKLCFVDAFSVRQKGDDLSFILFGDHHVLIVGLRRQWCTYSWAPYHQKLEKLCFTVLQPNLIKIN